MEGTDWASKRIWSGSSGEANRSRYLSVLRDGLVKLLEEATKMMPTATEDSSRLSLRNSHKQPSTTMPKIGLNQGLFSLPNWKHLVVLHKQLSPVACH
jgi:hypothetical protein